MVQKQSLQASVDEDEWARLTQRWPSAIQRHERLEVDDPFLTGGHQTLLNDGRRAEICYIAYERRPEDGLLLHVKTIYPGDAYRLPTGGIQPGEPVWDALVREIPEETGLQVGDDPDRVTVHEMLGVLSYEFVHMGLGQSFSFATYHFLVELPVDATLHPLDESERIDGWRWNPPCELLVVANTLDTLGERTPEWGDWGHFRALSHRFVHAVLT